MTEAETEDDDERPIDRTTNEPAANVERPTPEHLTRVIRTRALELGFHAVGFAKAEPIDPDGRLRAWLDRGFAGSLEYMATTAAHREDPRVVLPGARSVVALAISYYRPDAAPEGELKIARYAFGDDYHIVVRKKVRKLRRAVLAVDPTARVHPAVDSSPIMERAWAERAGIAWVGKSTMAISPRLGTYTFLATLVTTAELVYDEPHANRCGTCTACLDACPTQAFVGPYELDARRCITYWNVETREAFTASTPDLHGWIAGCDVCQEVCPWNKFAHATTEPRMAPHAALVRPDPKIFAAEEGTPEHAELANVVRGTALVRVGTDGVRRNTLRVLGARAPRRTEGSGG